MSLGGYWHRARSASGRSSERSGAVFYSPRDAVPWFVTFVGLGVVAGLLDPIVSEHPAPILASVRTAFFVLNICGVALTAFLLLQYSVRCQGRRASGWSGCS